MMTRVRKRLWIIGIGALVLMGAAACQLPAVGAAILLHPLHRRVVVSPPPGCEDVTFKGAGVDLQGWRGRGTGKHRGTMIYLHGVADNRASGANIIDHFRTRGFDVVAYDSRANGGSAGDACTYGVFEKQDLARVLDTVAPGPIVLVGNSLGAAVALQAAAIDHRVSAVVAAETFSDLRTVATERALVFFTRGIIQQAFDIAEQKGRFLIDDANPAAAAGKITIPVLLIHGAADTLTPPDHSRRVFAALAGPKSLILVPGAKHNESLRGDVWGEIDRWLDAVLGDPPG